METGFYGVSTDYLMGLTENKNHPNTELQSLHLSDDMVERAGVFRMLKIFRPGKSGVWSRIRSMLT